MARFGPVAGAWTASWATATKSTAPSRPRSVPWRASSWAPWPPDGGTTLSSRSVPPPPRVLGAAAWVRPAHVCPQPPIDPGPRVLARSHRRRLRWTLQPVRRAAGGGGGGARHLGRWRATDSGARPDAFAVAGIAVLTTGLLSDLTFVVEGKAIRAHRVMVAARCPRLAAMLAFHARYAHDGRRSRHPRRPAYSRWRGRACHPSCRRRFCVPELERAGAPAWSVPIYGVRYVAFQAFLHYLYTDHIKVARFFAPDVAAIATQLRVPRSDAACAGSYACRLRELLLSDFPCSACDQRGAGSAPSLLSSAVQAGGA